MQTVWAYTGHTQKQYTIENVQRPYTYRTVQHMASLYLPYTCNCILVVLVVLCEADSISFVQIEKEWQSEVTSAGNVYVTDLSEGEHIFVCSVASHCSAGMHIKVVVTGDSSETVHEQAGGASHLVRPGS